MHAFLERNKKKTAGADRRTVPQESEPQSLLNKKDHSALEVNEQLFPLDDETKSQSSKKSPESNCMNHCVEAMSDRTNQSENAELKLLVTKRAQCVDFYLGGDKGPTLDLELCSGGRVKRLVDILLLRLHVVIQL